jgi:hypothetical protein
MRALRPLASQPSGRLIGTVLWLCRAGINRPTPYRAAAAHLAATPHLEADDASATVAGRRLAALAPEFVRRVRRPASA